MTREEAACWLGAAAQALIDTTEPDAGEPIARAACGILRPALVRGPATLRERATTLAATMQAVEVGGRSPWTSEAVRAVRRLCLFARKLARAGWTP